MNKRNLQRLLAIGVFVMFANAAFSQVGVSHMLSRNGKNYGLGYGITLNFSFLSGDADFITVETSAKFFFEKGSTRYGLAYIPLKVGYKYTLNREGAGFYAEPQLGFNVYGGETYYDQSSYKEVNQKFNGVVAGGVFGFLFQPDKRGNQFDLAGYAETVLSQPVTAVSIGARITYNVNFGGSRY